MKRTSRKRRRRRREEERRRKGEKGSGREAARQVQG